MITPVLPLDLIVAGVGGQGSLFASKVIAGAAFHQGISVRVAETYGVAQRGGSVYSQIRLGHDMCGPMISRNGCPLILGLEPIEAVRRAVDYLAPGGTVILNTHVNEPLETKMGKQPALDLATIQRELARLDVGRVYLVDALALAGQVGAVATANVVMLGMLLSLPAFPLTETALEAALSNTGKPALHASNLRALAAGKACGLAQAAGVEGPGGLDQ